MYDLTFKKQNKKKLSVPSTLEIQFSRLTQTRGPSTPATPDHPRFLKSQVQHCCWGRHAPAHCPEWPLCSAGYRSGIGRDHFLTKQLQRYIEGLRRRRNKRLRLLMH